ncbi:MAG: YceI family protein [Epsilonproteobacteria bacterium]|nr:YceI family protein [Campylobacterota bacterium]
MQKLLLVLLLLFSVSYAEIQVPKVGCVLSQEGNVTVGWKAYKTPAKVGVGGTFNDIIYTAAAPEGKNFKEILVGSSVVIKTESVNSKNEGRDLKLVNAFFKVLTTDTITAKIVDIKPKERVTGKPKTGTLIIEITMNGVTQKVPMAYSFDKGVMQGEGVIDLFDFSASKALSSINKACFDLHSGKTWNDIALSFQLPIKATLCATKH